MTSRKPATGAADVRSFEATAKALAKFERQRFSDPKRSGDYKAVPRDNVQVFELRQESRWNWLDRGVNVTIRNQRDWQACASCASVSAIEARRQVAGVRSRTLSAGFIHKCLMGITDLETGSEISELLGRVRNHHVAVDDNPSFPVPDTVCAIADRIGISDFRWVSELDDVLNGVVRRGPMIGYLAIGKTFARHRGNGIFSSPPPAGSGDHAILLLGYDMTPPTPYLIIQNSMGIDWGVGGIGKVALGNGGLLTDSSAIDITL